MFEDVKRRSTIIGLKGISFEKLVEKDSDLEFESIRNYEMNYLLNGETFDTLIEFHEKLPLEVIGELRKTKEVTIFEAIHITQTSVKRV